MSSPAWAWFIAASSFTSLGVPLVLAKKGLVRHYTLQTLVAIQSVMLSFLHHVCEETEANNAGLEMCKGLSPTYLTGLDVMFAFLMLVLMVAPFIECWAEQHLVDVEGSEPIETAVEGSKPKEKEKRLISYGRWWRERYEIVMGTLATIMVAVKQDSVETYLVLALLAGSVMVWMTYREYAARYYRDTLAQRKNQQLLEAGQTPLFDRKPDMQTGCCSDRFTWRWRWIAIAACIWATLTALTFGLSKTPQLSYEVNRDFHGWFHVSAGLVSTFIAWLLPDFIDLPESEPYPALERMRAQFRSTLQADIRASSDLVAAFKQSKAGNTQQPGGVTLIVNTGGSDNSQQPQKVRSAGKTAAKYHRVVTDDDDDNNK